MKILKIILYIISLPVLLYLALFFEYLSFFSLILVLSVFFFRDLKKINFWWVLLLISILLDISMHLWFGTYFISVSVVLFLLFLFDKFVSNIFLDILVVFFSFLIFRFFFQSFILFQEALVFPTLNADLLYDVFLFAIKNIFIYLLLKIVEYFFKSYFRENTF